MIPGAIVPQPCPAKATSRGSFKVIQNFTLSPRLLNTTSAQSLNLSTIVSFSQPPTSWSACGRSQWYKVTCQIKMINRLSKYFTFYFFYYYLGYQSAFLACKLFKKQSTCGWILAAKSASTSLLQQLSPASLIFLFVPSGIILGHATDIRQWPTLSFFTLLTSSAILLQLSQAMSPLSSLAILEGVCAYLSQILRPFPSVLQAPSICGVKA